MKTFQHHSSSLGANIVGEQNNGLALFRGIPYADVSKRWTQSTTKHSLPPTFESTTFRPRSPQEPHDSLLPVILEEAPFTYDEFKCLNLNITAPVAALEHNKSASLLPVMVFIHGGAFKEGSNSHARNSGETLCTLAEDFGRPVAIVSINYRLGIFGFAATSDLVSEHEEMKDSTLSPYVGNYGLIDQKNALEWVQAHIQDFGGDPKNVTVYGCSAGSASIHMHIISGDPLFDRAIMQSGTSPVMGPYPMKHFQGHWDKLCAKAEASDLQSEQVCTSILSSALRSRRAMLTTLAAAG